MAGRTKRKAGADFSSAPVGKRTGPSRGVRVVLLYLVDIDGHGVAVGSLENPVATILAQGAEADGVGDLRYVVPLDVEPAF